MKTQEGLGRLKKVQKNSGRFGRFNYKECWTRFMKAWEDSKMFKKAQTGSIRFNKAQDGSRRLKKVIYGSRTL